MLFAELNYAEHYSEMHGELLSFIGSRYPEIEHGLQGDSWIWVFENDQKVAIDTFSSMKHQIKSSESDSQFVGKIIEHLASKYSVTVCEKPELEAHEE